MTWRGPSLEGAQHDLMVMLGDFAADQDVVLSDDPEAVGSLVAKLVELGVWTLGVAEKRGGGGADQATTSVALAQIGRSWPAPARACRHGGSRRGRRRLGARSAALGQRHASRLRRPRRRGRRGAVPPGAGWGGLGTAG